MPNKRSAIKELRKSTVRHAANSRMKTHVKSLTKQLKDAVTAGDKTQAAEIAKKLQQSVAKASKTHVFHKNKAQKKTSRAGKLVSAMK
ncbi:30S ribosomal protein S20 [bacterium]|uniref:Small ribosomal subunit protein bS20 n=1 Tax=Candidatus Uhrbacteria bacterium CG22_combo_CG10-13_8_21_14_all_47_17 TaxID=1975041 RepID=A0A2H0BT28_9BACT|nr:30S ribosomal protein S20 [bacterium]PIP60822.1 MAG: hypothetical protein COX00_01090 [Candidatus Uhrbacteria bacterium CG22_combo_CG10-13_8_21_14_all_47_17]